MSPPRAGWNEALSPRHEPLVLAPEVPREPEGWRRLLWWEDLLTFGLLGILFLAVIGSIDRARWVDGMPSLYPIATLGLLTGAVLARLRWPEGLVHLLAAPAGVAAVLAQILALLPGDHPVERFQTLVSRMDAWFEAAFGGGISSDELPFVIMVVTLSWLAAYCSAWAVFRWQNAWLALVPGGVALLVNISYLPGQFSFAFVVFLCGGALLVTRLHLMERAKAWRQGQMPYPPLLSLSVLYTTFWVTLVLVGLAWLLPQANEAGALESLWHRATAPLTERAEGLSRVFVSVRARKPVGVHSFDSHLAFQGSIELPDTLVLEVEADFLGQPRYLRAQVYELYTPSGWRQYGRVEKPLAERQRSDVDQGTDLREPVSVLIHLAGRTEEVLFSIGQPRQVDREVTAELGANRSDVTTVRVRGRLAEGERYTITGSISAAPKDALRAAGSDYPDWVRRHYLALPPDFSVSVRELAKEITRLQPTAYDKAEAIERYLRTIPYDLAAPKTPADRDAIEYFLFKGRRGYFDYHASAMVVMLRSIGIPARLAVGYVLRPEERDPADGSYRVTERNAFAWPEVYFPGLGWVEFNPTPSLPPIIRPGDVSAGGAGGGGFFPEGGLSLGGEVAPFAPEPEGAGAVRAESGSDRGRWVLWGLLIGFGSALLAVAGGLRLAWVRGLAGLALPAQLWEKTVRLASWGRLPPAAHQTPREYARHLRQQVPGLDDVQLLAEGYVQHRFGGKWLDEAGRARLEAAWRTVRRGLLRRLLRLG